MSRITQQQLESYLWGAATLLRGTIDAGDYKQFIFPLLFYKRLCDVFDEETLKALRDSGGDEAFAQFPENHRFQIPPEAHWREARKATRDVGRALQQSMRAIESANQNRLYNIFGDAQWTNKDRLSDSMLRDLVEHFSTLELTVANLPEDELGQGYEFLIKKFADDSGHTAAEFYTNRTVVHLMTEMLDVQPGESVYDPTCGSGGMLLSCVAHLRKQGKEWRNVKLFGQERNLMTSSIARMNCFLHGIEDFRIERGDTLAEPKLVEGDRLMKFDVVLANPPYSIKQWDREAFASDPWGRNLYGTPPQGRADYAFQQHILQSLKSKNGRCAVLWPHGVLFRKEEKEIRRKLIESDYIEAIIGLGPNLFYNSSMQSCIVVCRTNKPLEQRKKILFIDASHEVARERAQSFLAPEHLEKVLSAYRNFESVATFATAATLEEIKANDWSLNIPLYVRSAQFDADSNSFESQGGPAGALSAWIDAAHATRTGIKALIPGLAPAVVQNFRTNTEHFDQSLNRKAWRKVRLADVCDEISLRVDNPAKSGLDRFVGLEHFDSGELKIRRWGTTKNLESSMKTFSSGNVLFARRNAYLKRASLADFDGLCSGDAIVLRENRDAIVPGFLAFILNTDRFWEFAIANAAGTMSRRVNGKTLMRYEFDLPPVDEQRRIAEMLWGVDQLASEWIQVLEATDLHREAVSNRVFRKHQGEHQEAASAVCETITVGIVVRPASYYTAPSDGVPALRSLNVFPERYDLTELVYLSKTGHEKHRKSQLQRGDVVVVRTGRPGDAAVVTDEVAGMNLIDLILVRPQKCLLSEYLVAFLNSSYGRQQVNRASAGSAQQHFNVGAFQALQIPVPTLGEQQEAVTSFEQLANAREKTALQVEACLALQRTLINSLC